MDNIERRLKHDAEQIEAEVSPRLEARLAAAIEAAPPRRQEATSSSPDFRWWFASSLTGIAAVFLIVVWLNRSGPDPAPTVPVPVAVQGDTTAPVEIVPLDVTPAALTGPLAAELEAVKSDLEKARDKVRDDLQLTF